MNPDILNELCTFTTIPASEAQEKFQSLDDSFQQLLDDETKLNIAKVALSKIRMLIHEVLSQNNMNPELQKFFAGKLSWLLYKGTLAFSRRESKQRQIEQHQCLQDHRPLLKVLNDMMMLPRENDRDFQYILSVNPYSSPKELEQGLIALAEAGLIEEGPEQYGVMLSPDGYLLMNAPR